MRALFKLFSRKPDPHAEALAEAKAKRRAAWAAYHDAKQRGDTRDTNAAHRSYRHATLDVLRLEMGR